MVRLDRILAGLQVVVVGLRDCLGCRRWYLRTVDLIDINIKRLPSSEVLIAYLVCLGMEAPLAVARRTHTLLSVDP